MLQNRLWTAARLMIREWPNEYFCPLHKKSGNGASSLPGVQLLKNSMGEGSGMNSGAPDLAPSNWVNIDDFELWFLELGHNTSPRRKPGVRSIIMLILWELWKERNSRIFNKAAKSPEQLFRNIQDEARTWVRAGNKSLDEVLPTVGHQLGVVELSNNHVI